MTRKPDLHGAVARQTEESLRLGEQRRAEVATQYGMDNADIEQLALDVERHPEILDGLNSGQRVALGTYRLRQANTRRTTDGDAA